VVAETDAGRLVAVVETTGMVCGAALVADNTQENRNRKRYKILHFMCCSSPHFRSLGTEDLRPF
jgi:hypothetical protein